MLHVLMALLVPKDLRFCRKLNSANFSASEPGTDTPDQNLSAKDDTGNVQELGLDPRPSGG